MDISTKTSVSAIVEFDYIAKEPDEIDLTKGAIINNIIRQSGGWWEGTLASTGKVGMFPDNFVRVLESNDEKVILRDKSATIHRKCKVVYSYTQNNEDELSLAVGDVIEVLGEVEEGWWRGKLNDKIGVFPSNFVVPVEISPILANRRSNSTSSSTAPITIKKDNRNSLYNSKEDLLSSSSSSNNLDINNKDKDAPLLPPKPIREFCCVLYPYEPQNEDELELNVNDIITILTKELGDKGWWRGELRGKIGVFPDNFVVLLPPEASKFQGRNTLKFVGERMANFIDNIFSPSKDPSLLHPERLPPSGGGALNNNSGSITSSKVFIKKSGSGSSSQGSNRKDSFGSRDSLNDILCETGLQTGNVAAQRKSLENKNLDLTILGTTAAPGSTSVVVSGSNNDLSSSKVTRRSMESAQTKNSELRKSIENLDEKNSKTPPPVLTKKPIVPVKKNTSVTSVAGNLLSGFKQKVKNVEQKLSTNTPSLDSADGIGCSRLSGGQVADINERNIVGERIRNNVESGSDFDNVERSTILADMRAGRVRAPKRRPPSAVVNVVGENNNNNSVYLNGTSTTHNYEITNNETIVNNIGNAVSGSGASVCDEELAKPKPREWEKKKAPWMAELKASQEKKKTSPNIEPRAMDRTKLNEPSSTDRVSVVGNFESLTKSLANNQRRSVDSSVSASSEMRKEINTTITANNRDMTKSMSGLKENENQLDDIKLRPNSLSIRNRSVSPIGRTSLNKASSVDSQSVRASQPQQQQQQQNSSTKLISSSSSATNSVTTIIQSSPQQIPVVNASATLLNQQSANNENLCSKVNELENRLLKLETVVQMQNKTMEDLIRSLHDESEKVKGLKAELEKYAQCVTQV